jgi:tRNA dimethylallyltransferase
MLSKQRKQTKKTTRTEFQTKDLDVNLPKILVILGPTAAGKTSLAVQLAKALGGEIVSADARQVYVGMDIGTSKDLEEYEIDGHKIPYHLIDVADPKDNFDLSQYQKLAFAAIDDILSRKKLPIICGGSGLYLQAVVDNYQLPNTAPDFKLRAELESKDLPWLQTKLKEINQDFFDRLNLSERGNKRRLIRYLEVLRSKQKNVQDINHDLEYVGNQIQMPRYQALLIGLEWPLETLRERIKTKLLLGLDQGMAEEVSDLEKNGLDWQRLESFGLEYRYLARYLQGKLEYDEMIEQLNIAIGQFAKRQISWFKRWQKQGAKINWLQNDKINKNTKETNIKKAMQLVQNFLDSK